MERIKDKIIVYFSYGKELLHYRTIFSILTLWNSLPDRKSIQIIIWTDIQHLYDEYLTEIPIQFRELTPQVIKEMMGPGSLIHRVKIGILQKTAIEYPDHIVISLDSDTFFIKDPTDLFAQISSRKTLMHELEYPMEDLSRYPLEDNDGFGKVYQAIKTNKIRSGQLNVTLDFDSWNAGVIGLHPSNFDVFSDVYTVTDQLYEVSRNHACEQYAFSWTLSQRSEMFNGVEYIYHYWHKIKKEIMDEHISLFFSRFLFSKDVLRIKRLTSEIMGTIESHPKMIRYRSMIAFSESRYLSGYWQVIKLILLSPNQPGVFFRDVGYYTLKMLRIKS